MPYKEHVEPIPAFMFVTSTPNLSAIHSETSLPKLRSLPSASLTPCVIEPPMLTTVMASPRLAFSKRLTKRALLPSLIMVLLLKYSLSPALTVSLRPSASKSSSGKRYASLIASLF